MRGVLKYFLTVGVAPTAYITDSRVTQVESKSISSRVLLSIKYLKVYQVKYFVLRRVVVLYPLQIINITLDYYILIK